MICKKHSNCDTSVRTEYVLPVTSPVSHLTQTSFTTHSVQYTQYTLSVHILSSLISVLMLLSCSETITRRYNETNVLRSTRLHSWVSSDSPRPCVRVLTAFRAAGGLYQWTRVAMGLKGAGPDFQRPRSTSTMY